MQEPDVHDTEKRTVETIEIHPNYFTAVLGKRTMYNFLSALLTFPYNCLGLYHEGFWVKIIIVKRLSKIINVNRLNIPSTAAESLKAEHG